MRRLIPLCIALVFAFGCSSHPTADADRARNAVVAALDSWKANEPPTKLKVLADPVEFTDDLRATHTLTEYTVGKVDTTDKDVIRVTVTMKLKDKKGKLLDRETVYSDALKSPIVVARDPYY